MAAVQGYGAMGLSAFYKSAKTTTDEQAIAVIQKCLESGVTLVNSAVFYGPLTTEGYGTNLRLLSKVLKAPGVERSKIQLMVKIGMDTRPPPGSDAPPGATWNMIRPEGLAADVDYALEQLGTDFIDIIVLCRCNPAVPIEESIAAMKAIVDSGKAKAIGVSEASADLIRRAHAVHPLHCIEQEWSLWTRDIEADIVPTCRELGIKIVAYSPLGRGFLTNTIRSTGELDPSDYRVYGQPRFGEQNMAQNLALVDAAAAVAAKKGCTPGQLALAFLHAHGPDVIPIPGTSSLAHLQENLDARSITLTPEELDELRTIFAPEKVVGDRYSHMNLTFHAHTGGAAGGHAGGSRPASRK